MTMGEPKELQKMYNHLEKAFSRWLYIYCSTFGSPVAIKRKSPTTKEAKNQWFSAIFANIVLITTGEPNKLQKIHNHLEKAEVLSFLQMVVDLL